MSFGASSIWSPLASSTRINKLHVMQNCHSIHTRHKHTTSTWRIHEQLQLHASQCKQKTQHQSHPLHKHTPRHTSTLQAKKITIFNNGRYTTNMYHIHTSIVSRHLSTRGNNKINTTYSLYLWRDPSPPHLSHPFPTQNKLITLPQFILTQSQRQSPLQYQKCKIILV